MAKRPNSDLEGIFKQASEIALRVPEHLQEAAFNKAIDLLTKGAFPDEPSESSVKSPEQSSRRRKTRRSRPTTSSLASDDVPVDVLLRDIDSTQYPEISASKNVLEKSLRVLQLAHRDHEIDGLSPRDIAKILTDKFRIRTGDAAVRMALGKVSNLVDRVPQGKGFVYRIMAPGEEHLSRLESEEDVPTTTRPKTTNKGRRRTKAAPTKGESGTSQSGEGARRPAENRKADKKKPRKASSAGPKGAVMSLIEAGFFTEGRTGPDVQAHLRKKRGLSFDIDQLRVALLRLVRDEKLERDENAEGQYEYRAAKA